jgi:hypothetical protein
VQILKIDIEKLLEANNGMVTLMRPQHERYEPGEPIILMDQDSYTEPHKPGVYYKNTEAGPIIAARPTSYQICTVYKEKIDKLESHIAYMLFSRNAEFVKRAFKHKYPQSDYYQLVVLRKVKS